MLRKPYSFFLSMGCYYYLGIKTTKIDTVFSILLVLLIFNCIFKYNLENLLKIRILAYEHLNQRHMFSLGSYTGPKLGVGNSSVVKIYIMRPKPGPVAKNATPRPSGLESNPRSLDY